MISSELTEQLKAEGFPQKDLEDKNPADISRSRKVYQPTLEELIKACGVEFESLHYGRNRKMKWKATAHDGFSELGATPISTESYQSSHRQYVQRADRQCGRVLYCVSIVG